MAIEHYPAAGNVQRHNEPNVSTDTTIITKKKIRSNALNKTRHKPYKSGFCTAQQHHQRPLVRCPVLRSTSNRIGASSGRRMPEMAMPSSNNQNADTGCVQSTIRQVASDCCCSHRSEKEANHELAPTSSSSSSSSNSGVADNCYSNIHKSMSSRSTTRHSFISRILFLLVTLTFITSLSHALSLNRLNSFVRHYEPLNYDHGPTLEHLHRTRRDTSYKTREHSIIFESHGRHFHLRLKRDVDSVFGNGGGDGTIENGDGHPMLVNLDHLVTGYIHDQPRSKVIGSIRDGIFEGRIDATVPRQETFYVERANKHFLLDNTEVFLHDQLSTDKESKSRPITVQSLGESIRKSRSVSPSAAANRDHLRRKYPFHSVIYSAIHVVDPKRRKNSEHFDGHCAQTPEIRSWMEEIANSALPDTDVDDDNHLERSDRPTNNNHQHDHEYDGEDTTHDHYGQYENYVRNAKHLQAAAKVKVPFNATATRAKRDLNINESQESSSSPLVGQNGRQFNLYNRPFANSNQNRARQQNYEAQGRISFGFSRPPPPTLPTTPISPSVPKRRACSLYIQTDTFLWDHVKKHEVDKSDAKVREEIASLVAQHIKAVNHIYENSKFKDITGLKFIVQRLRINDTSSCEGRKRETNHFCAPNIDVSNFLNMNSQFNHNDFCLAYIFTYRDFSGGTLGLAWVASTSGASGGICEKYKTYTENINGRQVQTKRSLNTGIITFVNYNSRVPPKVSELTLAHEIGHNFGSPHDFPAECRPGGPLGNYIMYSSATSGERQNNNKFSDCSVYNISTVLHAVFNNEGKENCFQEDNGPFCGNKIVEEGEECDCGYDSRECNEDCCYPRNVDEFKHIDPYAQPCRRRPGASCSPSEGPCCTERCVFEGEHKQCRDVGECTESSQCSGRNAHCPAPPAKPNKTECNMGTQVCWSGACTGSICQKYGLEECFPTTKRGAKTDEMCEVACQEPGRPDTCRRTSEIQAMSLVSGLKLRPGSPCNDFLGYCDVFQRCRPVDAEGPLARLKNLLFNKKTLMTIKQWITTYWWACTLMLFCGMLFMAAFIKCCAVHTPSSNPKRKKALRLSETLRRPADTLRRKNRSRSRQHGSSSNNGGQSRSRSAQPRSSRERSRNRHSSQQPQQQQTNFSSIAPQAAGASQSVPPPLPAPRQQSTTSAAVAAAPLVVNLPPPRETVNTTPSVPPALLPAPFEPPPPYPGIPKESTQLINIVSNGSGPSRGYGEGRGHYNRQNVQATSSKTPASNEKNSKDNKKKKDDKRRK